MLVARTKRNKHFPGDTSIAILIRDGSVVHHIMNLFPRRDRLGRFYESDSYTNRYRTITEAKTHALNLFVKE